MDSLAQRIKQICKETGLKQKDLAALLGVSASFISALSTGRNLAISIPLAESIETKLGYRTEWLLKGTEPKMKTYSKAPGLSDMHQRAIAAVEKLTEEQARAVLAFINYLLSESPDNKK